LGFLGEKMELEGTSESEQVVPKGKPKIKAKRTAPIKRKTKRKGEAEGKEEDTIADKQEELQVMVHNQNLELKPTQIRLLNKQIRDRSLAILKQGYAMILDRELTQADEQQVQELDQMVWQHSSMNLQRYQRYVSVMVQHLTDLPWDHRELWRPWLQAILACRIPECELASGPNQGDREPPTLADVTHMTSERRRMLCPQCHSKTIRFLYERQMRRSDEPATEFFVCLESNCRHQWRRG